MDDLGIKVAFVTSERLYNDQREQIEQRRTLYRAPRNFRRRLTGGEQLRVPDWNRRRHGEEEAREDDILPREARERDVFPVWRRILHVIHPRRQELLVRQCEGQVHCEQAEPAHGIQSEHAHPTPRRDRGKRRLIRARIANGRRQGANDSRFVQRRVVTLFFRDAPEIPAQRRVHNDGLIVALCWRWQGFAHDPDPTRWLTLERTRPSGIGALS